MKEAQGTEIMTRRKWRRNLESTQGVVLTKEGNTEVNMGERTQETQGSKEGMNGGRLKVK